MMEATPPAPFIMPEPNLLLEFLIIAFDAPPQLGGVDQIAERDVFRQGREPVLGRRILALGPAFQPYWGKPAVRNDRGDRGNVGIMRSPIRASILPDHSGARQDSRKVAWLTQNRSITRSVASILGTQTLIAGKSGACCILSRLNGDSI
jgi:hypothetical protein